MPPAQEKWWKAIDPHLYLLFPMLLLLALFMVVPVLRVFILSFFDPGLTLKHYVKFFQVSIYAHILLRTLLISVLVSVFTLIAGYPVAYLMADVSPRKAKVLMIFVILPMWTGILVRTYAWMVLLGRQGLLNKVLLHLDLVMEPVKLLYTSKAVILAMVQILLPLMILPLYATMKGIDRNLLRASKSLGAGPVQTFVRVFLPLSTPGILAGLTLVFIISLAFFITPALVGGRRDIMIAMLIESQITRLLNWGFAAALSLILMAMTLAIIAVFNRFIGINRFFGAVEA